MDKRTRARELAMQGLYQLDVQGLELLERLGDFLIENESEDSIRKLAYDWTKGTWKNLKQCDELIVSSTIKWQLSRLSPVDKSILRLGVYQLQYCPENHKWLLLDSHNMQNPSDTDHSTQFSYFRFW